MTHHLTLPRQCTLRDAEAFRAALLAADEEPGDFVVDATSVERIDTAGLQLLVAFARRLRLHERRLVWGKPSAELLRGAARLGLTGELGLPAPESMS
jgi:anti-anti-sigma regulatory factor